MRILSWNVNGLRAVGKRGFPAWVTAESPDVLCIQETKARPEQLPGEVRELRDGEGRPYHAYWASAEKGGYAGVAIYSRVEPARVETLGVPEFDAEGRVLRADFASFTLITAYFPNSQDAGRRLDYKLAFCGAMMELCRDYAARGRRIVLCGDYNIAHTAIDLARPRENEGNPGFLPEERAWMDAYTRAGFADTFRRFHPGETGCYTWWSYRGNTRARNVGWRIDYHCVDEGFLGAVTSSRIRAEVEGSDHCPVEITLDLEADREGGG